MRVADPERNSFSKLIDSKGGQKGKTCKKVFQEKGIPQTDIFTIQNCPFLPLKVCISLFKCTAVAPSWLSA